MSLIQESPALTATGWPAGQRQTVSVPVTLSSGNTLADFASFVLTIREDPDYPRSGAAAYADADPVGDGWPVVATAAGTVVDLTTLSFVVAAPTGAGRKRYALDVRAEGGTAGPVSLVDATWLTVRPRVGTP